MILYKKAIIQFAFLAANFSHKPLNAWFWTNELVYF